MSGICGTFSRSGNAAAVTRFGTIQEGMAHWVPDRQDEFLGRLACMGHMMREATPEDTHDHQPRTYREFRDAWVITADACLYNRDELIDQLHGDPQLAGCSPGSVPDSALLLAAYRAWGVDCPGKLLGDFAFAIWDEEKQELFCARDHMGVRPFYYLDDGDLFCFANDVRGLATVAGNCLDKKAVASYLRVGELLDEERTFVDGVRKLPPASWIRVSKSGVERTRYWRYEDVKPFAGGSLEQYVNQLRELLDDAVKVRLRRAGPLACHLSGGLDSSVIAAIAARHEGEETMLGFNWAHSPGPDDDPEEAEWANARMLAEQIGIRHEHVELSATDLEHHLENANLATHTTSDAFYEGRVRAIAARDGVRVVLSGWGGDELISNNGRRRYSGEFLRGRFISALRGWWGTAGPGKGRSRRFLGAAFHELARPVLSQIPFLPGGSVGAYLACASREIVAIARKQARTSRRGAALTVRGDQLALLQQGHLQNRMESWANAGREDGIEYRFPLLDRRVVEFALALPAEYFREGGFRRLIMREAANGLLPDDVRLHRSKLEAHRVSRLLDLLEDACLRQIEACMPDCEKAKGPGVVNVKKLSQMAESIDRSGPSDYRGRVSRCITVYKSLLVLAASTDGSLVMPGGRAAKIQT